MGQAGGPKGLDINVVPAWQQGFSGAGVAVCVLDDGIEHTHDDLKQNYVSIANVVKSIFKFLMNKESIGRITFIQ